jgi:hypothetical protein
MAYNIQFVYTGTRHDGTFYLDKMADQTDGIRIIASTPHQDIAKRFASEEEALAFAKWHTDSAVFSLGVWTVVSAIR